MLHVIITVRRERIGSAVGVLSAAEMARIDQALIAFLGLAD
jgi:mRNA-degrading endonuclease toxin of MazEF toxin-antitoxin module